MHKFAIDRSAIAQGARRRVSASIPKLLAIGWVATKCKLGWYGGLMLVSELGVCRLNLRYWVRDGAKTRMYWSRQQSSELVRKEVKRPIYLYVFVDDGSVFFCYWTSHTNVQSAEIRGLFSRFKFVISKQIIESSSWISIVIYRINWLQDSGTPTAEYN